MNPAYCYKCGHCHTSAVCQPVALVGTACVLWELTLDGWRITFRGKRWECEHQQKRYPPGMTEIQEDGP